MSILIKDVLLGDETTHVYIEDNTISEIGRKVESDEVIDGKSKAIIPGLINTHTHAAMSLFRGYADDLELHNWLQNKIWPLESKLKSEDVYWGTKLACLEMIKTGTTTFNDMYYFAESAGKAVEEMGIRGVLSQVFFDMFDKEKGEEQAKETEKVISRLRYFKSNRVVPALGPHAIYTVSKEMLEWIGEFAGENDLLIHFHLCETEREVRDCIKRYGKSPVRVLEEIKFLSSNLITAHCVWLSNEDVDILSRYGVKVSHNPTSNMKLSVGRALPYSQLKNSGITISLSTDGCASNNNLDMFESMKFATLLQKYTTKEQTVMPASETFKMATVNGARALRMNAGEIKEGMLADVLLIDLKRAELIPNHNLISNLVYSANGYCVDTTICDGKILMRDRKVEGEEEILSRAIKTAKDLVER